MSYGGRVCTLWKTIQVINNSTLFAVLWQCGCLVFRLDVTFACSSSAGYHYSAVSVIIFKFMWGAYDWSTVSYNEYNHSFLNSIIWVVYNTTIVLVKMFSKTTFNDYESTLNTRKSIGCESFLVFCLFQYLSDLPLLFQIISYFIYLLIGKMRFGDLWGL